MMMRVPPLLLQILFLAWVSSDGRYVVILGERRSFGEGWEQDSWLLLFEIDLGDGKVPMGFEDLEPLLFLALERCLIRIELLDELGRIALHCAGCVLEDNGYAVIPPRRLGACDSAVKSYPPIRFVLQRSAAAGRIVS